MAIISEPLRSATKGMGPAIEYQIMFRRASDGKEFPGNVLSPSSLEPAFHLAQFDALRQGAIDEYADTANVTAEPIFAADGNTPEGEAPEQVAGLNVVVHGREQQVERRFGLEVFEAAAQADLVKLVKSGQLGEDKKAVFRVVARRAPASIMAAAHPVVSKVSRKPLALLEGRLSDWLSRAQVCGPVAPEDYPLFLVESALERAREYCFKPDRNEGGAMLMGHLYRQIKPQPEIFGVVDAVLELRHARHERFALTPTPETLADLTRQWTLRQTRLGRPHEVPLALAHSHDFLPSLAEDGEEVCPSCVLRPTCQLVSSFYSAGDLQFHTGLFSKQPWVAGIVFGLTPRTEKVIRMFVVEGARSRERGYHLVCDIPGKE